MILNSFERNDSAQSNKASDFLSKIFMMTKAHNKLCRSLRMTNIYDLGLFGFV